MSIQALLNLFSKTIPILQPVLMSIIRVAFLFFGAVDFAVNIPNARTPE